MAVSCIRFLGSKTNLRLYKKFDASSTILLHVRFCESQTSTEQNASIEEEEFRTLDLMAKKHKRGEKAKRRGVVKTELLPPRSTKMPIDQDWTNVWPAARMFHPAVVPLPLHQGYVEKGAPPGKYANAELMKIPNFLHLTPPAIKKHCAAIRKFCTEWPEGLETDEKCERHFPVEIITNDYCYAGPSVRDHKARIVTLKIRLSLLELDYHARDKLLRLVGNRYDPETDILTLVADRCPLKMQNYDYLCYLLTALYYESWKKEPWESEKTEEDMEKYFWEGSKSQNAILNIITDMKEIMSQKGEDSESSSSFLSSLSENCSEDEILDTKEVQAYKEAVTNLWNEGEDAYTLQKYKESVCNILGLKSNLTLTHGEVMN